MDCTSYGINFNLPRLEIVECWRIAISYDLTRGHNFGNHRSEGLQIFTISLIKFLSSILCARALRVLTCASDLADMWSCRPTLELRIYLGAILNVRTRGGGGLVKSGRRGEGASGKNRTSSNSKFLPKFSKFK